MAKAKDFGKISNNAASKFLSNTDNEPMQGQLEINNLATLDKKIQESTESCSHTPTTNISNAEVKSKRLNLLIQPSLMTNLKKIAYINKTSVNELIVRLIKDYTDQEEQQSKIKKYDNL